ncbi:polyadenylate-binding protein-interacting protein 2-like [Gouania willdenowi]|uniref:Polyadenylate-binding protein-interacting protein 2-like n=1 Tax=Gouania willdenowi TaxID=441366 RepID=A0A8C5DW34_GOUWI|nr:polyadenylate-binding protein-interacting protein 2-like [Gouania willdenowi]
MREPTFSNMPPNTSVSSDVVLINQMNMDENPFAEFMWMENEEDFDRQVEEELREEEFIERCFQEMLEEEEQWEWFIPSRDLPAVTVGQIQEQMVLMGLDLDLDLDLDLEVEVVVVTHSSLNPYAKEFTPGQQKHTM